MTPIEDLKARLPGAPARWLVTGVAGFIGSHLLEALLNLNQYVVGLDNFSTGHQRNLDEVRARVGDELWQRFHFVAGDIRQLDDCKSAFGHPEGPVDYVLHQAALGSVPRSIEDPITTNQSNIDGFLNMLVAAKDARVRRFVYAASSSTYGDHPGLPKLEETIGQPLSPYAVTKYVNELYAQVFARTYGLQCAGLRYFNVFGPRQDPNGAYAAVIPKWAAAIIRNEPVFINGDGETSRDFCYVDNVVQANLLAATSELTGAEVFNVAYGERTSLNDLFNLMRDALARRGFAYAHQPVHRAARAGDVRHSLADISKARRLIGYVPARSIRQGMESAVEWYAANNML